jgi:hypothetical protein
MWEPQPLATLRASMACKWITLPLHYTVRQVKESKENTRTAGYFRIKEERKTNHKGLLDLIFKIISFCFTTIISLLLRRISTVYLELFM